MSNIPRFTVVVLLTGHGLIPVLGAAKGFGWAEVNQLSQPIGPAAGALWLNAAGLVLASAAMLVTGAATWWCAFSGAAALTSQLAIATSWGDAKAGTACTSGHTPRGQLPLRTPPPPARCSAGPAMDTTAAAICCSSQPCVDRSELT